MSKFRARQLDASKPISIYFQEDISDTAEFNNVTNRTVPQLPTGMEKEEETEHHLQQAIFHNRIIPVPEVFDYEQENGRINFNQLYPPNFKLSRQMVHIQPFAIDQDVPDYDMDSEDELWLDEHSRKGEMLPLDVMQFEEMMDRLEKASGLKAVTLPEAKLLLKDDDDLITTVYDYWLNKRLRLQHPLIPHIRCEKSYSTNISSGDPYMAFRKRTEKMQTRKNRKNDEASYEKMLKLRRDLTRAIALLDLIKRREKFKRELIHHNIEIHEKRYKMEDFSGAVLSEINAQRISQQMSRSVFTPIMPNQNALDHDMCLNDGSVSNIWLKVPLGVERTAKDESKRERRPYKKKRKHVQHQHVPSGASLYGQAVPPFSRPSGQSRHGDAFPISSSFSQGVLSEDELLTSYSEAEDDVSCDGVYAFRRRPFVTYHAPREPSERESPPLWDNQTPKKRHPESPQRQFHVSSLSHPSSKLIGLARRRVGRGGRIWLDRIKLPLKRPDLDTKIEQQNISEYYPDASSTSDVGTNWSHFFPRLCSFSDSSDESEVDVETIPPPRRKRDRRSRNSPRRADHSSSGSSPSSVLDAVYISAEVVDGGSYHGSSTDLQVTFPPPPPIPPLPEDLDALSSKLDLTAKDSEHSSNNSSSKWCNVDSVSVCGSVNVSNLINSSSVNVCDDSSISRNGSLFRRTTASSATNTVDGDSVCGKTGISNSSSFSSRWTSSILPSSREGGSSTREDTKRLAPLSYEFASFHTQPSSLFKTCDARVGGKLKSPTKSGESTRFFYGFESSQVPHGSGTSLRSSSSLASHNSDAEVGGDSSSFSNSSVYISSSALLRLPSSDSQHASHSSSSFLDTSPSNSLCETSASPSICPTASSAAAYTLNAGSSPSIASDHGTLASQNQPLTKKLTKLPSVNFRNREKLRLESFATGLLASSNQQNKNNGNSPVITCSNNSKLVRTPKFISSWASNENTKSANILSNGPTSNQLDAFSKCPKVTPPVLFPET